MDNLELALQSMAFDELEDMDAPDWWTSALATFAVSCGVSATYGTLVVTSVVAT